MKTNLRIKPLLALLLAIILAIGCLVPTFADGNPFKDVSQGAWYYEPVMYCKDSKLFKGTSDTTFSPDDDMTRAMFVTVLGRYEGIDENQYRAATTFSDVVASEWYGPYVKWASDNKIVKGYDAHTFGTDDKISREQMVTMFYRYATFKGYNLSVEGTPANNFGDYSSASAFATEALNWAVSRQLIRGTTNGLDPLGNTLRAQVAQVFYNIHNSDIMSATSPQTVFEKAAPKPEPEPETPPAPTKTPDPVSETPATTWKIGDVVTMGTYKQNVDESLTPAEPSPIEWVVLDVQDGKALLITKNLLLHTKIGYDTQIACWETSESRAQLNGEFYNTAFSDAEKQRIQNTTVKGEQFKRVYNGRTDVFPDPELTGAGTAEDFYRDLATFNERYARDTVDKLFLLSADEVTTYFVNNEKTRPYMEAYRTSYAAQGVSFGGLASHINYWLLRTPCDDPDTLRYVDAWGQLSGVNSPIMSLERTDYASLRPAMWVTLP